MFAARLYLAPNKPRFACCGKKISAEEKNTLNLSFNVNPWLERGMGAFGHLAPFPSFAPAGEPAAPGRSAPPCFAAESARAGTLMSLPEGAALCEPQVHPTNATPAEGLQVFGFVVAAFGQRYLVDDLQDEDSLAHDGVAASGVLAGVVVAFFDALA